MSDLQLGLQRLRAWWRRRRNARRIGVSYTRGRSYVVPSALHFGESVIALALPRENGVAVAFAEIFLDDCYGLTTHFASARFDAILDIGANVGLFSLAARMNFPRATIHSYEPNACLAPYLSSQSAAGNFAFFLEAVGRSAGRVALALNPDSVLVSTIATPDGAVQQIAFSAAVERMGGEVGLVKMDCEGAEWEILSDRDAWQRVAALTMEYHLVGGRKHDDAPKVVGELGFRVLEHARSIGCGIIIARRG
jgi:FkbM family methyltransferase